MSGSSHENHPLHKETEGQIPEGMRVLVVDDEQPVREMLRTYLERHGFEAVITASAEEALSVLRSQPFDAILSDYSMPGMNGVELYRRVQKAFPGLAKRFLLITGTRFTPEVVKFIQEAGANILEKPFRLQELSNALLKIFKEAPLVVP